MLSRKKMILIFIGIVFVVFAIVAGICWFVFFAQANPPLPQADVTIQPVASDTVLGSDQLSIDNAIFDVEIASTTVQKMRGLSYRASLGENAGMLFLFGSGSVQTFWMKDMNFPIDMIWIRGNTVVGFAQNAAAAPDVIFPTSTYSSPDDTDKVLEVNAGTVAKYNIKVGDIVMMGPVR
jgi:uncharacterized membrane protein (UPF0127 family)